MGMNWKVVKDLRTRAQDEALHKVEESAEKQQQTMDSLNQILSFIRDYKDQLTQFESQGAPIASIIRTRHFIDELTASAAAQEQLLVQLSFVTQQDKLQLIERRAELKAVEKLELNEIEQHRRYQQSIEAKELDELARRQFMANSHSPS
ncbi:flagellar export protein FliJ [Marinobacterium sp. xm-a-152]|jgi:flagellar export protein FliJ|uniref:flagellar export protein FliJ n=1 Tax=Marinobacterium sp. xm-a-152 TaxID=2497733 RepID=UPI001568C487|nr:flagellar export protein FliJ [Marinobacterium sp. xm-a-152]NRP14433.1 flagellar biosynthesis chaperone [Marinobacterium sp. xm-a-152]